MTAKEIIDTLRVCVDEDIICAACQRYDKFALDGPSACIEELMQEAADALEELQKRLAAYEDTGYTPAEINDLPLKVATLEIIEAMYYGLGNPDHLRDLIQAEKDGRLMVFQKDAMETSTTGGDCVALVKPSGDLSVQPCPFCGGNNIAYWQYRHPAGLRWRIACLDCMAMIDPGWAQHRNRLKNMWDKRAYPCEEADAALKGGDKG